MFLHYDTETDGLNISGQPSDHPDQPGTVSITAFLDDQEGNTIETLDTLIKPVRAITPEVVAIHGITTERAEKEGITQIEALRKFAALARRAEVLVAFNHFFDWKMVKIMCARAGDEGEAIRQMLETKSAVCTMDAARKHLKAGRFIKLGVAYQGIMGEEHSRPHESFADAAASRAIFYRLRGLEALPEQKPLTRKEYTTPPPPREVAKAKAEDMTQAAEASIEVAPARKRPAAL